jgi:hypothetical protein
MIGLNFASGFFFYSNLGFPLKIIIPLVKLVQALVHGGNVTTPLPKSTSTQIDESKTILKTMQNKIPSKSF